jgi:hypothetical protein
LFGLKGRFFALAWAWKGLRAAAVNAGRRPPQSAARTGVEGREPGATVEQAGLIMPPEHLLFMLAKITKMPLRDLPAAHMAGAQYSPTQVRTPIAASAQANFRP